MKGRRQTLAWVATLAAIAAVLVAWPPASKLVSLARAYGLRATVQGVESRLLGARAPHVRWKARPPEEVGLSGPALDSLANALAARGTAAFLVVRDGKLVFEWYEPGRSPNAPHPTAALAKAVVGSMVMLTLAADGVVGLDDRAAEYVPAWQSAGDKSRITLRELANHASGLDDVYFPPAARADAWFLGKPAWKRRYYDHPEQRFRLALDAVPLLYAPGTAHRYSGIGYYVLAYAMAIALHAHSGEDLRRWLARRVYGPLGIPIDTWQVSYGQSYSEDDLTLFAIGSGAGLAPRALARVGQAVIDGWDSATFAPLHGPGIAGPPPLFRTQDDSAGVLELAVPHFGWWGNDDRAWPSLPADALVGLGANDQAVLVVPSLRLVAVRVGESLSGRHRDPNTEAILDRELFAPLARALR